MGQYGISVFNEKRYPASQRTIVLQFPSAEEAEAWDRAGQPIRLLTAAEDVQDKGDDRQDHNDGPQHVVPVPVRKPRKPATPSVEFANLGRPQSKRRRT